MQLVNVPCGKCPQCMARRVSAWSFRLMQEEKRSSSAHFITLTYDTKYVPLTRNGFMTLDKSNVQKFLKRLRKLESIANEQTIKYYLAGEYGGTTSRPHYHAIIFNVQSLAHIEAAWQQGQINYGKVSGASIGYTLKYINKRKRIPTHRNDDRIPEFALMSKGLGASYINDKTINYHTADLFNRMCLNIEGNKKISMPRYYKDKLYTESQRAQCAAWHKQQIEEKDAAIRERYGETYDGDLAQNHLQQFRKQEKQSKKRDKL